MQKKTQTILKRHPGAEMAGWMGALTILTAYILASFDVLSTGSTMFQVLNLVGALGIVVISVYKRVTQSVIVNVFWAAIALVALVRIVIL